jgi:hypothetical protein
VRGYLSYSEHTVHGGMFWVHTLQPHPHPESILTLGESLVLKGKWDIICLKYIFPDLCRINNELNSVAVRK